MAISKEDLQHAFEKTHVHSNGCDFEKSFSEKGDHSSGYGTNIINSLYHTLELLDSPWKTLLLQSDGGIQRFLLLYTYRGLPVLIDDFRYPLPFISADDCVKWLNDTEIKLLFTLKF